MPCEGDMWETYTSVYSASVLSDATMTTPLQSGVSNEGTTEYEDRSEAEVIGESEVSTEDGDGVPLNSQTTEERVTSASSTTPA